MAVDLKILGWSAIGLRCPDHKISFEENDKKVAKISLIQMPNGTGKTTVLKLLRAALYGPPFWDESDETPNQFRKSNNEATGRFVLNLLHNDLRLSFEMLFDFGNNANAPKYSTISVGGKDDGFRRPKDLTPFLTSEFVKLLIFDGEQAAQLLDSQYTNAQKAIEGMYQLPIFDNMMICVEEYWKNKATNLGSKGGQKEYSRRKNRLDKLKEHLEKIKQEKKVNEKRLEEVSTDLERINKDFETEIKKDKKQAERLKSAEETLVSENQALKDETFKLASILKNPLQMSSSFSNSVLELKESFDRVKLPGIAAREFFEEIADEENCICGRCIDEEIKATIQSRAKQYLGSEEVAVLNAMKSDIKENAAVDKSDETITLKDQVARVKKSQESLAKARNEIDTIRHSASDNNPELKKAMDKITKLNQEKGRLTEKMLAYSDTSRNSDDCSNPKILEKRLEQANNELAETTGTIQLKNKKDILQDILQKVKKRSIVTLGKSVTEQANTKIKDLMPYNNIRIDSIDRCLKLVNKEGGSVGETLAVGYAFLSALLSNANHNLPLVIDSPSGSIDLEIRPEIGKLVPKLSDQFISFTISSERQNFVNPLVEASNDSVMYFTLFRKGHRELETAAKNEKEFEENGDGFLVKGEGYFNQFHTDKD